MRGTTLVHPYDNFNVICGQGTSALELLSENSDLDIFVAPVGGGGLMSGTSVCAKGTLLVFQFLPGFCLY